MQPSVQTFIRNTEQQYNLKCNPSYFTFPVVADQATLIRKLFGTPIQQWTLNNNTVQRIVQTNEIKPNTLLQIQTGLNISEPGRVSLCKPNSTVKLFLTDGHSMKALVIKGCSMDLKDNVGRKLVVKAGNVVKYGILMLKNYEIMEKAGKMEEEGEPVENEFEGLEDLIL